ncbi:MAG: malectin domain-containing carbohydrate-binding protein [Actinomycetota bacterium]
MRQRALLIVLVAGLVAGLTAVPTGAVNTLQDRVVSANPADGTPWVTNGRVYALVQIGTTMYVGGTFTQAQEANASTYPRAYLFAFDTTTGAISRTFKPTLDAPVNALATDGTSLFVGGDFTTVNGATHRRLVALDASGAPIASFAADVTTGATVDDLVVANGLVYLAGAFTQIDGVARSGLAAVDPVSGSLAAGVNVAFTGLHNNGTSHVAKIDVSPNGATLVAVGNFTTVGGQPREQMALLDLAGQTASVSSWATARFVMQCASKFDTYIRDIDIDPTGTYVVVGTTGAFYGGVNANTLCDSVSRWELGRAGGSQQPTWVDYAGGDTTWSVTATGTAIYTGGHYRWYNNPYAGDTVGPGTIKRHAIAALDPVNGMPLSWNPGRSPGEGVFIMLATADGLWVGDDTNQIGGEYHPRLAFFPLAGGTTVPVPTVATLPGELYSLPSGACPSLDPSILYRVNAAGPSLPSLDCGPDWSDDTASSSPYRNTGSNTTTWSGLPALDATVPAMTPAGMFGTERWDAGTSPEMQWDFPVTVGRHVRVRLYFADRCSCTNGTGSRVFDVAIDGATVLDNWDANASVGHNVGTMRAFDVTSDGSVTIEFAHGVNNPEINGIELLDKDATPVTAGGQLWTAHRTFDGATAGARTQQASAIDWSRARGAFFSNGKVYYGWDDGKFYRRTFNGTSFGSAKLISTNGLVPGYFPIPSATGMFLQDGRLYYTVRGDDRLYDRYFSLESSAVGAVTFVASAPGSGFDWGSVRGLTLAGGTLYLARADGTLWSAGWTPGLEHGTPVGGSLVLVSADPAQQWASRGMFVRNP